MTEFTNYRDTRTYEKDPIGVMIKAVNMYGMAEYRRILRSQLAEIPQGMYNAHRYDTDTTHVLSVWADGKTYDIVVFKEDLGMESDVLQ
jgi:hypothetical protein